METERSEPVAVPRARQRGHGMQQRRAQSSKLAVLPFDASVEEIFAGNPYYSLPHQASSGSGKYASVSIQQSPIVDDLDDDNPTLVFGPVTESHDDRISLEVRQPSFASIGRLVLKGGCSLHKDGAEPANLPSIVLLT